MTMALCFGGEMGGRRFLYEVRPDIFPYGFLTKIELELWGRFVQEMKRK